MRTAWFLLAMLTGPVVQAQECVVRGRVVDADGHLPFASVAVGPWRGTTTMDGLFITGPCRSAPMSITVKVVGMKDWTDQAGCAGSDTIDLGIIRMEPSDAELADLVISGTLSPVSRDKSPVPVEVITPALFRKNPGSALLEAVGMVNGVRPQLNGL